MTLQPGDPSPETLSQLNEKESKYHIKNLPDSLDLNAFSSEEITQGYFHQDTTIIIIPKQGGSIEMIDMPSRTSSSVWLDEKQTREIMKVTVGGDPLKVDDRASVRVRQKGDKKYHTLKVPVDSTNESEIERVEAEFEVGKHQFDKLSGCVAGNLIEKTRYTISKDEDFEVVCDVFHGYLDGLILVEVEAKGRKGLSNAKLPKWIKEARNVSNVPGFSNEELSRMNKEAVARLLYGDEQVKF